MLEGHKSDGGVLEDLDPVSGGIITETPCLASISDVRGENCMIDIYEMI